MDSPNNSDEEQKVFGQQVLNDEIEFEDLKKFLKENSYATILDMKDEEYKDLSVE